MNSAVKPTNIISEELVSSRLTKKDMEDLFRRLKELHATQLQPLLQKINALNLPQAVSASIERALLREGFESEYLLGGGKRVSFFSFPFPRRFNEQHNIEVYNALSYMIPDGDDARTSSIDVQIPILFSPTKNSIPVKVEWRKHFYIPLSLDQYNISQRLIRVSQEPEGKKYFDAFRDSFRDYNIKKDLHPELQASLDKLLHQEVLPISTLVEGISSITKEHYEYPIEEWMAGYNGMNVTPSTLQQLKKTAREKYQKPEHARQEGDCSTQGRSFRELLGSTGLPRDVFYTHVGATRMVNDNPEETISHDLTAIIDAKEECWFLVNSLSPTLKENIIPKEHLSVYGRLHGE